MYIRSCSPDLSTEWVVSGTGKPLCLWFVWMTFGDVTELSQSCIMNYDIGAIGEVNYVLYVMRNLTIVGFS